MRWPYYEHVFFDCDSTLTTVEGIDILAESVGKKWRVEVLTRAAMDGNLDLEDVYAKRLRAIRPTRAQIQDVRNVYKRNIVADAAGVIAALQALGHKVYIISGGLAEPVEEFGVFLGVPRPRIRAVVVDYDRLSGQWWQRTGEHASSNREERYLAFDEGALTVSDGKAQIVRDLLGDQPGRSLLVGDGISDLHAGRAVSLFAGFGGVVRRERVLAGAPVFVHSASLAPLLALAAGPAAYWQLQGTPHAALAGKALDLIATGAVTFQDERLKNKFSGAFRATIDATAQAR